MLHSIGRKPSGQGGARGVVARLADCHERIRRFTALAIRLGDEQPAPAEQIREAANQTISYFVRSLPHHSADEDESIAPRLAGIDDTLALIATQHLQLEVTLDTLVPLWRQVAADPDTRGATLEDLRRHAARLQEQFEEHLQLEETILFPAIDRLPPEVQDELIVEMVSRRLPKNG